MKTTRDFQQERLGAGPADGGVGVINLGCARNLTDAQMILGRLKKNGHRIVEAKQAQVIIVNTCSFIEDARKESVDTILDLIDLKKKGKIQKIIVAGCLAQRYGKELAAQFKDVDAFVGTPTLNRDADPAGVQLTPRHFAYVKICESCFNACSFCAIPKIKGRFISRTVESVLQEVARLDAAGVKEINLIGQDITAYGLDIYRTKSLARLLKEMARSVKNIRWIRLLYAFPAHVTDELIEVMAGEDKICKYIDMPLQHISDHILAEQNRHITRRQTLDLVARIRSVLPRAFVRTTYIVGLPGETKEDFEELRAFNQQMRFERVGVFIYSKEEGTAAHDMPGHVPARVKRERMDILMRDQQAISREIQKGFVGRRLNVLIDEKEKGSKDTYIGRSEYDAPDVDGVVYVRSKDPLKQGDMVEVDITDAYEYDLAGVVR
ncbi:MAG: 30S ribosomal protein S12 methylthiotransferase RimO [Candidatus Omnitrophota bacterium]|nr:30S ribosomal protein S12 methylthiotransferase RimO [Candidatus Omnitrophota bacterium]